MIQLDPAKRPTIDQILEDEYFKEKPLSEEEDYSFLRDLCDDLISRANVYKMERKEQFCANMEERLKVLVQNEWAQHVLKLGLYMIYGEDPDEKKEGQEDRQDNTQEVEKSSSDEEIE